MKVNCRKLEYFIVEFIQEKGHTSGKSCGFMVFFIWKWLSDASKFIFYEESLKIFLFK